MAINDPQNWIVVKDPIEAAFPRSEIVSADDYGNYSASVVAGGAFRNSVTWAGSLLGMISRGTNSYAANDALTALDGSNVGTVVDSTVLSSGQYIGAASLDVPAVDGVGVLFKGTLIPAQIGLSPDGLAYLYVNGGGAIFEYTVAAGWQKVDGGLSVTPTGGAVNPATGELSFSATGNWNLSQPFSFNTELLYACYPTTFSDGTPMPAADALPPLMTITWFSESDTVATAPIISYYGYVQGPDGAEYVSGFAALDPASSGTCDIDVTDWISLYFSLYDNDGAATDIWFSFAPTESSPTDLDIGRSDETDTAFALLGGQPPLIKYIGIGDVAEDSMVAIVRQEGLSDIKRRLCVPRENNERMKRRC